MNRIILSGRLANDPEARTTQSGIAQASFRLAVRRRMPNADGSYDSDFFNCVAWRGTADYVTRYLAKGESVMLEGQIQERSYIAQDNSKRYIWEVNVDRIEHTGSPRGDGQQYRQDGQYQQQGQYRQQYQPNGQYAQQPQYQQPNAQYQQPAQNPQSANGGQYAPRQGQQPAPQQAQPAGPQPEPGPRMPANGAYPNQQPNAQAAAPRRQAPPDTPSNYGDDTDDDLPF